MEKTPEFDSFKIEAREAGLCAVFNVKRGAWYVMSDGYGENQTDTVVMNEENLSKRIKNGRARHEDIVLEKKALKALRRAKIEALKS
jgi:hypothetical protein